MKLLMIGHLLGDFYFQTDHMVSKKKKSSDYILLHCLLYSIIMYLVLVMASGKPIKYIWVILITGISHLVIDWIKAQIQKRFIMSAKGNGYLFAIDQLIHILILWVISCMCVMEVNIGWFPGISENMAGHFGENLIVIIAFLFYFDIRFTWTIWRNWFCTGSKELSKTQPAGQKVFCRKISDWYFAQFVHGSSLYSHM